jgi:hypothetical protein
MDTSAGREGQEAIPKSSCQQAVISRPQGVADAPQPGSPDIRADTDVLLDFLFHPAASANGLVLSYCLIL